MNNLSPLHQNRRHGATFALTMYRHIVDPGCPTCDLFGTKKQSDQQEQQLNFFLNSHGASSLLIHTAPVKLPSRMAFFSSADPHWVVITTTEKDKAKLLHQVAETPDNWYSFIKTNLLNPDQSDPLPFGKVLDFLKQQAKTNPDKLRSWLSQSGNLKFKTT